jgi:hypothetical protein
MSIPYAPDPKLTIGILLRAAERAALESGTEHPEDIAAQMSAAVEAAAQVVYDLHKEGLLRPNPHFEG